MTNANFQTQKDFEIHARCFGFISAVITAKALGIAVSTVAKWVDQSYRNMIA